MNTKSLLTRIGVPVLSLGLLGGAGATLATSASAATLPGTVTAQVHEQGVPDTTFGNNAGPATLPSDGGPVWAYDNLERKMVAVQDQADPTLWHVTLSSQGSYQAFASPITGEAWVSGGPVSGWVTHDIHSITAPSPSNLKGNLGDSGMRSTDIMKAYFGGDSNSSLQVLDGASHYNFNYKLNGVDYNQAD
jgi:hypothetical protein